jgi:hypothetical protein
MAERLENGRYLLDRAERDAYASAARLVARVDNRQLDLAQPLDEMDYLLVMCAHLIVSGDRHVDERLMAVVDECLEERRRHSC